MRKRGMAAAGKPRYDGTCRNKKLGPADGAVVRFKAPQTGNTVIQDVVKGNIVFQNTDIDDFIIQRSDGTPMYNLAVVVDDITMQVNTIIRGDDHVSNTPKQILLYKALGALVPVFGHVPMVLGNDRARLSKRHGATSVTAYRDMGFLPEAFLNYLVRLGWSHGDQEFFTLDELIEKFSLENIGHSAGVFDMEKLMALNADHIKAAPPEELSGKLIPFLKKLGIEAEKGPYLESVIKTLNARSKTLVEMAEKARFYFQDAIKYDEKAARKVLKPIAVEPLKELLARFADMDAFTEPLLEDAFRAGMAKTGLKLGKIAQPVRVALTGRTASPGIFEIIEIIGKKKVMARLEKAIDFIEAKNRE